MRRRTVLIILSLLFIIAIPFVTKANDDKGPGSLRVIPNLAYDDNKSESQMLDLYIPTKPTAASQPLIAFIHGGAWLQGDKSEGRGLAPMLAQAGFATASVNYRLTQIAPYPAQIDDCKNAIRYLRNHAKEYGYDGNKIGVWGVSAGGHLAALLGTMSGIGSTTTGITASGNSDSAVQAVCDWCGPADLVSVASQAGSRTKIDYDTPSGPVAKLLGGLISDKMELAVEASPVSHISKDDPPFLIVHGEIDDLVPFAQSKEFVEKLKAAGVPVKLTVVKGAGHNLFSEQEVKRMTDFFRQVLIEGKKDFQSDN